MGELSLDVAARCFEEPRLRGMLKQLIRAGKLAGTATAHDLLALLVAAERAREIREAVGAANVFDETCESLHQHSLRKLVKDQEYRQEPAVRSRNRERRRAFRADPDNRERENEARRERRQDPTYRCKENERDRALVRKKAQAKLSAKKKGWQDQLVQGRQQRKAKLSERLRPLRKAGCGRRVDGPAEVRDSG